MALTDAQEKGIRELHDLDAEYLTLIRLATQDLYDGPIDPDSLDDDDRKVWRGFAKACETLANDISWQDLWVDQDGCVQADAPSDDEDLAQWWRVEAKHVRAIVVGKSLAEYL